MVSVHSLLYEMFRRRAKAKKEEKKEEQQKKIIELYKRYCKGKESVRRVSKELVDVLKFLHWDVDPRCIPKAAQNVALMVFISLLSLPVLYLIYQVFVTGVPINEIPNMVMYAVQSFDVVFLTAILLPPAAAAITYFYLATLPFVERERIVRETVPTLPETIGYFILSVKLTPNLEKAMEFAGENGEGMLAEEFKRTLWEVRMGLHTSTEEAIDKMAYRWGKLLPEVKHALMRIRGAVLEADEGKRYIRLDQALGDIIDSVRRRMEDMASKMYMPSVQLFYLGVFLPLLLFIVIPVAAAFSDMPVGSLPVLVGLYIILIPFLTYTFAKSILSKRPAFYEPPEPSPSVIPGHPRLRQRAIMTSIITLIVLLAVGYYLHTLLDTTYEKVEVDYCGFEGCLKSKYGFESWSEGLKIPEVKQIVSGYDTTPYWLVFGTFIAVTAAFLIYVYLTEKPREEILRKYEEMEGEFKDVAYLLASRMGEGKPLEGALDSVAEFMPDATIVREIFSKIAYNIKVLGYSLRDAIFDPIFGALRDVPSKFLRKAMNILVRSVELGTELAAKSLLSYSEQLRKEEEIIEAVKNKMSEIRTMMLSMAVLVGPIVLGITVALQQVIISSLSSFNVPEVPQDLAYEMGINIPSIGTKKGALENMASPLEFLIVVFLYNLILTALLTWYATKLYEGNVRSRLLLALGRNLLISSILFALSAWISVGVVRGMIS